MKIAAIISEYNPFTQGHAYHIAQTRSITNADAVICIMSGNFVQRGEPAIYDKYFRTRLALEGGADAVLELPALFATQSAELFAFGAVKILNSLNCIDYLSFGAECDLSFLFKVGFMLADEPYSFKKELGKNLDNKEPFATARSNAIATYFNLSDEERIILSLPNAILAIEYIKKLVQFESRIQPISIQRVGAGYNDKTEFTDYMSATAIRTAIKQNRFSSISKNLPTKIAKMISQRALFASDDNFFQLIKYAVMRSNSEELSKISGITEGLENSFIANTYLDKFDDMLENVHSKRFTRTAIRRMMYNILLGITKNDIEHCKKSQDCLYARVLGFRQASSYVLKYISENSSIPVITNVPAYKKMLSDTTLFDFDILASDIYKLATGMPVCDSRPDFKLVPAILGNDFPEL